MSLESILANINKNADIETGKIIQEAKNEADKIIQQAKAEADIVYRNILAIAKADYERNRQQLIVNAHIQRRKILLQTKQELIDIVFKKLKSVIKSDRIKKQQVYIDGVKEVPENMDFYIANLRRDNEAEIARILFV